MQRILAISNQKGGVGKTTTAINLASGLTLLNQRVLLIDMDPQGNASSGLGLHKSTTSCGIADVLRDHLPMIQAVHRSPALPDLHIAPATSELIGITHELFSVRRREFRLKDALRLNDPSYDYIVIDCPPSLNLLTINALAAADSVLVPLQAEYFALEGIHDLLQTIQQVRKGLNVDLTLSGVIMTMVNMNTCLNKEIVEQAHHFFGSGTVFDAIALRNVQLSEAASHGLPIHLYAPQSIGALNYTSIAKELLFRDGRISSLDEQPLPANYVFETNQTNHPRLQNSFHEMKKVYGKQK